MTRTDNKASLLGWLVLLLIPLFCLPSCGLFENEESCQRIGEQHETWHSGGRYDFHFIEPDDPTWFGNVTRVSAGFDGKVDKVSGICIEKPVSVHAKIRLRNALNAEDFTRAELRLSSTLGTFNVVHSKANFYRTSELVYEANIQDYYALPSLFGEGFPGHVNISVVFYPRHLSSKIEEKDWRVGVWLSSTFDWVSTTTTFTDYYN